MSSFVACGGTGAHVMLAMVRLHILGYPFGFFSRKKDGSFPDLFLVDQDNHQSAADEGGKGSDEGATTAWGEVQELINKHPGRYRPEAVFGFKRLPHKKGVTPLPVGPNRDWFNPPNNKLEIRFQGSGALKLITSQHQRDIDYSRGMMASPAVGALLFSLKEYDTEDDKRNNDRGYDELLSECRGNVIVCGSSVGGTGASVAPTLALRLQKREATVMAVLIHRWFEFSTSDQSSENRKHAKERNEKMRENAAGGLAHSGKELAGNLPAVLVGVPDSKLESRIYTGDNQQAHKDSYIHVIGALASMRHLLSDESEVTSGLYGVSASDPSKLTGEIKIGDGKHSTLEDLAGQAEYLAHVLGLYCEALEQYERSQSRGVKRVVTGAINVINFGSYDSLKLKVCDWVCGAVSGNVSKVQGVAQHLKDIKDVYDGLLEWLGKLEVRYDMSKVDRNFLKIEQDYLERRNKKKLPLFDGRQHDRLVGDKEIREEEYIALALFDWTAEWIKDWWGDTKVDPSPGESKEGYWPSTVTTDPGGGITWGTAGTLAKVEANDVSRTLADYFDRKDVSANGWPDPIAMAEHYRFQIELEDPVAIRKLEILLVARTLNLLKVEEVEGAIKTGKNSVSLEKLIEEECPYLAKYRLVHREKKRGGKSVIYGFSSPRTLLCPMPDTSNKDWKELWEEIISHRVQDADWLESENWGQRGKEARRCIASWIKRLGDIIQDDYWKILVKEFEEESKENTAFGIAEWLPLFDDEKGIPLPVSLEYANSIIPSEGHKFIDYGDPENDVKIPFDEVEGFEIIENLMVPGMERSPSMIWREHLDKLQERGDIFAWWRNVESNEAWIMQDLRKSVIHIKDLRVIDTDIIRIKTCIPLKQQPVPKSRVEKGSIKFPDLPLLPDYISLAETAPDKDGKRQRLVDANWSGCPVGKPVPGKRDVVAWELHLAGRLEPVEIEVPYTDQPVGAHWMIWPNFKAMRGDRQWKAYYLYENAERESLEARVVLSKGSRLSEPKKRPKDNLSPSRAVEFDAQKGIHTGGPPVALCAYDDEAGGYTGIYKICLEEFEKSDPSLKLAVDFGTSHTVAAIDGDDDKNRSVALKGEFTRDFKGLSRHISENWPDDPSGKSQIRMQLDLWRPTYIGERGKRSKSVLPSDLWAIAEIGSVEVSKIEELWKPMTHFVIPPMKLHRTDSERHIISGFKWRMRDEKFKGKETWLQKKYLGMAIEIFLADIVREKERLPKEIQFTFTYPLRGISTGDTGRYEISIDEVLERSSESLGYDKTPDEGLLYSESHAAADTMGEGAPFEVKLVADLGGGTLDILIATSDKRNIQGSRFEREVADSAKVGADLLLEILAEEGEKYLPAGTDKGWGESTETRFNNLRAWMRSQGSYRLFGRANPEGDTGLKLRGFDHEQLNVANASRDLIERYFWLITDFLARSLVAYVAKDVWNNPKLKDGERKKLKLIVQLRGNGWRLWYGSADYEEIQQKMGQWVRDRAETLWEKVHGDVYVHQPSDLRDMNIWYAPEVPEDDFDPKLAPILNAVGKNRDPDKEKNYKFPLSKVLLRRSGEEEDGQKAWFESLPFRIEKDPENTSLGIEEFDPPLCMHSPVNSEKTVKKIENSLTRKINKSLQDEVRKENGLDAPVAALVWERMLESSTFRKGQQGGSSDRTDS